METNAGIGWRAPVCASFPLRFFGTGTFPVPERSPLTFLDPVKKCGNVKQPGVAASERQGHQAAASRGGQPGVGTAKSLPDPRGVE